jgi:hypothetical protein
VERQTEALEEQLTTSVQLLGQDLHEATEDLLGRLQSDADCHKEAQQALHQGLSSQVHDLRLATHTKIEAVEHTTADECRWACTNEERSALCEARVGILQSGSLMLQGSTVHKVQPCNKH